MFVNNNGHVETKRDFPKRMTWKKALKLSIEKWEFILNELKAGRESDTDSKYCALCYRAYISNDEGIWCSERCPVVKRTNQKLCRGTPYHRIRLGFGGFPIKNVQAEIDFLKSL